jgi:Ca2+-binding RTX toxin-like protein
MAYNYILTSPLTGPVSGDDDVLYGARSSDDPNGGNDVIRGLGGDDHIYAKFGDDIVDGGRGNDFLDGGWGNDTFSFGSHSGYDVITALGREDGNTDTIVAEGNYNGYYVSPITGEVVLKFDHNINGYTDARVLLAGVYEDEWLTLEENVIVTDPNADAFVTAQMRLAEWDGAWAAFSPVIV